MARSKSVIYNTIYTFQARLELLYPELFPIVESVGFGNWYRRELKDLSSGVTTSVAIG